MSDIEAAGMTIETAATARASSAQRIEVMRELALAGALPLFVLFAAILYTTNGHFTYSFDDPYIHLALARNIWLGHYGINLTEASAPSSSILWPFLLAPFASLPGLFEYVPLVVNAACLIALVFVIGRTFDDVRPRYRIALIVGIAFWVNAYGLVFTGMEHSLQLLLIAVVLRPHLRSTRSPAARIRLPAYVFVALAVLPLVRYEDCAISAPLLLLAALRGQWRAAALSAGLIVVSMGGFSLFLHHHGLGFLPSSVLAKESMTNGLGPAWNVLLNVVQSPGLVLMEVCLAVASWRRDRTWGLLIATVCVLHLLFGKSGAFGRYDAYLALFVALCGARLLIGRAQYWRGALAVVLLGVPFAYATVCTPAASSNIYYQQAQLAEIVRALGAPVAANDIGLIALRGNQYLLDLYGLGSVSALRARQSHADPVWMSDLMQKKGVHYAIIYDRWFPTRPAAFQRVGTLTLHGWIVSAALPTVTFYATDSASAAKLRQTLRDYAASHTNRKVSFEID
ncbi:hypothetical protein [Paraburkholderia acidisoli]|uniref:Glycosyltransferase RgtA/B/C/D-like domain-containing protein n=1 Tax=Paraburkholderia acidisoli TaxID=2571748 RepID=A0A7Z2GQL0_9BURK|nr:hypothetical protein [Paraburkholderia acidisoli]QGZ66075.1 hypothetical protein FAZ98_30120 [Paraburkholderia acidisoli]